MKTTVVVVLSLFAVAAALPKTKAIGKEVPECPEPGEIVVNLPNPDDCSTFYTCDGENPVLMDCFPGLWFNPDLEVCDYPGNIPEGSCLPPVENSGDGEIDRVPLKKTKPQEEFDSDEIDDDSESDEHKDSDECHLC